MPIYALGDRVPAVHPDAFVHPDAILIGDVRVGPDASVWPAAVLRGDYGTIEIGERTSVQDGSVLHAGEDLPTVVGPNCVVGHLAHLEGCRIEEWSLVGTGSIVLHHAVVGTGAMVAAGAVVTNGMHVPAGSLAVGTPATVRPGAARREFIVDGVDLYVRNARRYRAELRVVG